MNRNIEVGCLVLCTNGLNTGKSGEVLEGSASIGWMTDFGPDGKGTLWDGKPVRCRDVDLLRIDGYQETSAYLEDERDLEKTK